VKPHNPTGAALSDDVLRELHEFAAINLRGCSTSRDRITGAKMIGSDRKMGVCMMTRFRSSRRMLILAGALLALVLTPLSRAQTEQPRPKVLSLEESSGQKVTVGFQRIE
jgi:hypothetical protein